MGAIINIQHLNQKEIHLIKEEKDETKNIGEEKN